MDKLKVFSKKLNEEVQISFDSANILCTTDGILMAWNNSYGHWLDQGWNNSYGKWQDQGWNNNYGNWIDQGWNNSYGKWQDQGWSNSSGNWGDSGSSGGGCFITTACVEAHGLPDNCKELQILRQYRDELVKQDEKFREKVLEYYRKAPLIIQKIDKSDEKNIIYDDLYDNMICPCVKYLEEKKFDLAKTVYLNYYEALVQKYLVG